MRFSIQNLNKSPNAGILPGPPIITALVVAAISFGISKVILGLFFSEFSTPLILTSAFALVAMLLCPIFKLPYWWQIIFLIFSLAFAGSKLVAIPLWIYPVAICLLLFLNWNSLVERVPFFLTNMTAINELSNLISNHEVKRFTDLGCANGGVILSLAKKHPNVFFSGVETSPLPYLIARLRLFFSGQKNVSIRRQSIWHTNLQSEDMVYAFLSTAPMDRLVSKCKDEMKKSSMLISNSFNSEQLSADFEIEISDNRNTKFLFWRL